VAEDFHGVGVAFPFGLEDNRIGLTQELESIEQSIKIILGTGKGERVMRPEFGCGLQQLAFSPVNDSTASLAIFHIKESLRQWEPRIEVEKVDVSTTEKRNCLEIAIEYRVITSNNRYNLIYPFYLERGEEA